MHLVDSQLTERALHSKYIVMGFWLSRSKFLVDFDKLLLGKPRPVLLQYLQPGLCLRMKKGALEITLANLINLSSSKILKLHSIRVSLEKLIFTVSFTLLGLFN